MHAVRDSQPLFFVVFVLVFCTKKFRRKQKSRKHMSLFLSSKGPWIFLTMKGEFVIYFNIIVLHCWLAGSFTSSTLLDQNQPNKGSCATKSNFLSLPLLSSNFYYGSFKIQRGNFLRGRSKRRNFYMRKIIRMIV